MENKTLTCGCCGDGFKTWKGYVNQDQDLDYGICFLCQADEAGRGHDMTFELIAVYSASLFGDRKIAFDDTHQINKEYIVHQAFNDGIIKLKIGDKNGIFEL